MVKTGWGPVATAVLGREAQVLASLRHPGVVELVHFEHAAPGAVGPTRLITRLAGVHSLRTAPPGTPVGTVTRIGQLLATLATLHARGLGHGAVGATHVVVGPSGSARWCGLGRCAPMPPDVRHAEVRATAELGLEALAAVRRPARRRWRTPDLAALAGAVLADDRLDAEAMATTLMNLLAPRGTPHRVPPREGSTQPHGDLVGEQTTRHAEHHGVAVSLHEPVEHAGELIWWQR